MSLRTDEEKFVFVVVDAFVVKNGFFRYSKKRKKTGKRLEKSKFMPDKRKKKEIE